MSISKHHPRGISSFENDLTLWLWSEYLDRKFLISETSLDIEDAYSPIKTISDVTIAGSPYEEIPISDKSIIGLTWEKSKENPHNWSRWKKAFHTFVPSA